MMRQVCSFTFWRAATALPGALPPRVWVSALTAPALDFRLPLAVALTFAWLPGSLCAQSKSTGSIWVTPVSLVLTWEAVTDSGIREESWSDSKCSGPILSLRVRRVPSRQSCRWGPPRCLRLNHRITSKAPEHPPHLIGLPRTKLGHIRAHHSRQRIAYASAKAEAGCADFAGRQRMCFQPLRGCEEILNPFAGIDLAK